jgi:uncharacterized membrane protein YagU involved in acid resistance
VLRHFHSSKTSVYVTCQVFAERPQYEGSSCISPVMHLQHSMFRAHKDKFLIVHGRQSLPVSYFIFHTLFSLIFGFEYPRV